MSYGIGPDVYTLGMHVMGRRDAVMKRTGEDAADTFHLRNFLAYSYRAGVDIRDGDACGADDRPLFRVTLEDDDKIPAGSPMHNPFGRYRLNPLWDPARGLGRE